MLIAAAVVPLACYGTPAILAPLVALFAPLMFLGGTDGEFYSEGFPCVTAVGLWMYFVLAVGVIEAARPRLLTGTCVTCGYSLDGATSNVRPECGATSTPASRSRILQ